MRNKRTIGYTILALTILWMAQLYQSNMNVVKAEGSDPTITVDTANPVTPGAEVNIFLTNFPTGLESRWMGVDFSDGASVNVEVDDAGNATTSHRYACGHTGQIMASPLSNPSALTSGPVIETVPCTPPPPEFITPTITGPETGVEGIRIDFTLTGTPGYTATVRFGDGDTQLVVVTFDVDGNAVTNHTYPRGDWPVSVDGGDMYTITISPPDGCGDLICTPVPPVTPTISGPPSGLEGELITFSLTGTPNGFVHVRFGNGHETDGPIGSDGTGNTTHQYSPGTFEVSVDGGNTITLIIHPAGGGGTIPPPTPIITGTLVDREIEAIEGNEVTFKVRGTANVSETLDFGDGTTTDVGLNANGRGRTTHTYQRGTWIVRLLDGTKLLDSYSITINPPVGPIPTIPSIHGPRFAKAGEPVTFTVTGTPNTEVTVTFGDGESVVVLLDSSGNGSTSHTYAVGNYTVGVNAGSAGGTGYSLFITADGQGSVVFLPLVAR